MNADTIQTQSSAVSLDEKLKNKEFPLQILNRDMLKYIAIIFMTLGHWAFDIAKIIPNRAFIKFAIGVEFFAPPVFFFFIAEGYHYTKDRKKYALRLLLFAVITQIPQALINGGISIHSLFLQWSVIMTLFLGLLALIVLHSTWKLPLRLTVIAGLIVLSRLLTAEWYICGIILIICFDLLREKPLLRLGVFEVLMFASMCVQILHFPTAYEFVIYFIAPMSAGIVITFFYNGKKGHFPTFSKWFFYIWYPLHRLIQYFV